jgi:cellulose synthase/poly-beta-1,6-N-acetylglucosamine synthase-like glycosyltransferase
MDTDNSIKVNTRTYELGMVFNINKLNFNWKDLDKFDDLKNTLKLKNKQNFYEISTEYTIPTLILDKESIQNTDNSLKILHMSICLPCYDEEWCEISGTLRSLSENILIQREKSDNKFKIHLTLYIIQDGWNKASNSFMEGIQNEFGCPDKLWITNNFLNSKLSIIIPNGELYYPSSSNKEKNGVTFYPIFITKIKNCHKFNSHLLFFSLCYIQKPDCVFLTDAGTIYDHNCISNLLEYIYENNSEVIGVTGKQRVMNQSKREQIQRYPEWSNRFKKQNICEDFIKNIYWWLSPAPLQGFEFESSFIINTAIFNLFGALPVLPGPCQLLWWDHLENFNINNENVLDMYFRHLNINIENSDIIKVNTLLVEDRILSLCMLFRTYKLKTICISKSTFSYEPMMTWTNLLNQRKRWINGTISTYIYYSIIKQGKNELQMSVLSSKNYLKLLWNLQLYQSIFQAISPCFFIISLFESAKCIQEKYSYLVSNIFYTIYEYKFDFSILISFLYFLFYLSWVNMSIITGKNMLSSNIIFKIMIELIYTLYSMVNSCVSIFILYTLFFENSSVYSKFFVLFLWVFPLLYTLSLSFTSVFYYIIYSIPFLFNFIHYISFIPSYAFARLHDISWGNRDSTTKISIKKYREFLSISLISTILIIFINSFIFGIYIFLVNNYNMYDYIYIFFSLVLLFPIVTQYIITFVYFIVLRIFK